MIRVLVADDQVLVRQGFALILGTDADIEVVGEAGNGVQLLAGARQTRPDVVLMDIQMPEMDGIEATRHLTSSPQTAGIRVLILTTFGTDEYVYQALAAGASGFLLKDTAADDLIAAVRTVAAGEALLAPAVTRALIETYVLRPGARLQHPAPVPALPALTERERDTLAAVARGLSNTEIACELHVSYSTVKTREPSADKARRPGSGPAGGDRLPVRSGHLTSGHVSGRTRLPFLLLRSVVPGGRGTEG